MSDTEAAKIEATYRRLAESAAEWPDEEFASRIVGLLIEDKGLVNAWQRTIEMMVKVCRYRDEIIRAKGGTL